MGNGGRQCSCMNLISLMSRLTWRQMALDICQPHSYIFTGQITTETFSTHNLCSTTHCFGGGFTSLNREVGMDFCMDTYIKISHTSGQVFAFPTKEKLQWVLPVTSLVPDSSSVTILGFRKAGEFLGARTAAVSARLDRKLPLITFSCSCLWFQSDSSRKIISEM